MSLRAFGRAAAAGALALLAALAPARPAAAQEKKIALVFTAELLGQIATDSAGEQTAEIIDRIIGLSPAVRNLRLQRASGRIGLYVTVDGVEDVPVSFQFTVDKMLFYRMRTARADVSGMTEALQEAKRYEPLLLSVGYRFDGRYSIVDATLDMSAAIKAARELQARREAEAKAEAESRAASEARARAKVEAETKAAAETKAKVEAEARAAAEVKAKAEAEARAAAEAKARAAAEAAAAAKAPAPPPAAPPKEAGYVAARALGRDPAPVVDGSAADAAWAGAPSLAVEVQGTSGRFTVNVQAVWSPERLWLLLRWADKTRDILHRPWVWSKEEKAYVAGRDVEDAAALAFTREGRMGDCMLAGAVASTDLWNWRAGRTDPSGYAEDATMTLSFQRLARANSYQTRNGRTVWIKEDADAGSPPYQAQVVGAYAGERMPRYIPRTPSGSMADVAAKGSWKDGVWTVEFSRRLSTGDPADVVFAAGRDVEFAVAIFDRREGMDHSTSKELTLKLE